MLLFIRVMGYYLLCFFIILCLGLRTPKSAASFLKTPQTAIGQSGKYNRYKSSLIGDLFIIYNESVFNGKVGAVKNVRNCVLISCDSL